MNWSNQSVDSDGPRQSEYPSPMKGSVCHGSNDQYDFGEYDKNGLGRRCYEGITSA